MSREKLSALEETKNYVFHGSPDGSIEQLEPRQSTHVPDTSKPHELQLDGDPAVSATPYADFAVYRALVNNKNIPIEHASSFGRMGDGSKRFGISSEEALAHVEGKKGYVYVFDRENFKPWDREGRKVNDSKMEWRSNQAVKPVEVVEVTHEDLPPRDLIEIEPIN